MAKRERLSSAPAGKQSSDVPAKEGLQFNTVSLHDGFKNVEQTVLTYIQHIRSKHNMNDKGSRSVVDGLRKVQDIVSNEIPNLIKEHPLEEFTSKDEATQFHRQLSQKVNQAKNAAPYEVTKLLQRSIAQSCGQLLGNLEIFIEQRQWNENSKAAAYKNTLTLDNTDFDADEDVPEEYKTLAQLFEEFGIKHEKRMDMIAESYSKFIKSLYWAFLMSLEKTSERFTNQASKSDIATLLKLVHKLDENLQSAFHQAQELTMDSLRNAAIDAVDAKAYKQLCPNPDVYTQLNDKVLQKIRDSFESESDADFFSWILDQDFSDSFEGIDDIRGILLWNKIESGSALPLQRYEDLWIRRYIDTHFDEENHHDLHDEEVLSEIATVLNEACHGGLQLRDGQFIQQVIESGNVKIIHTEKNDINTDGISADQNDTPPDETADASAAEKMPAGVLMESTTISDALTVHAAAAPETLLPEEMPAEEITSAANIIRRFKTTTLNKESIMSVWSQVNRAHYNGKKAVSRNYAERLCNAAIHQLESEMATSHAHSADVTPNPDSKTIKLPQHLQWINEEMENAYLMFSKRIRQNEQITDAQCLQFMQGVNIKRLRAKKSLMSIDTAHRLINALTQHIRPPAPAEAEKELQPEVVLPIKEQSIPDLTIQAVDRPLPVDEIDLMEQIEALRQIYAEMEIRATSFLKCRHERKNAAKTAIKYGVAEQEWNNLKVKHNFDSLAHISLLTVCFAEKIILQRRAAGLVENFKSEGVRALAIRMGQIINQEVYCGSKTWHEMELRRLLTEAFKKAMNDEQIDFEYFLQERINGIPPKLEFEKPVVKQPADSSQSSVVVADAPEETMAMEQTEIATVQEVISDDPVTEEVIPAEPVIQDEMPKDAIISDEIESIPAQESIAESQQEIEQALQEMPQPVEQKNVSELENWFHGLEQNLHDSLSEDKSSHEKIDKILAEIRDLESQLPAIDDRVEHQQDRFRSAIRTCNAAALLVRSVESDSTQKDDAIMRLESGIATIAEFDQTVELIRGYTTRLNNLKVSLRSIGVLPENAQKILGVMKMDAFAPLLNLMREEVRQALTTFENPELEILGDIGKQIQMLSEQYAGVMKMLTDLCPNPAEKAQCSLQSVREKAEAALKELTTKKALAPHILHVKKTGNRLKSKESQKESVSDIASLSPLQLSCLRILTAQTGTKRDMRSFTYGWNAAYLVDLWKISFGGEAPSAEEIEESLFAIAEDRTAENLENPKSLRHINALLVAWKNKGKIKFMAPVHAFDLIESANIPLEEEVINALRKEKEEKRIRGTAWRESIKMKMQKKQ